MTEKYFTVNELSEWVGVSTRKVRRSVSTNRIPPTGKKGRSFVIDINLIERFSEEELKSIILEGKVVIETDEGYRVEKAYTPVELVNKGIFECNSDYLRLVIVNLIERGELEKYKRASNLFIISESQIDYIKENNILETFDVDTIELEDKDYYSIVDLIRYTGFNYDKIYNKINDNVIPAWKRGRDLVIDGYFVRNHSREDIINLIKGNEIDIKNKENNSEVESDEIKKDVKDSKKKPVNYIYRVELKENEGLFPYTACDGDWLVIQKELDKAKHLVNKFTSFPDEFLCDMEGESLEEGMSENDVWYFTVLPDSDKGRQNRLVLLIVHSRDKENVYRYYVSPVRLEWMEDNDNVKVYKINNIEYAVDRFIEENPEFKEDMETVKKLLNS